MYKETTERNTTQRTMHTIDDHVYSKLFYNYVD